MTLLDVARKAGVDRAVVSRVLRSDPALRIRPETRERVMRVVKELGYRPNAAARSLRTARSGAFGLIIPDFANAVYSQIIAGAEQEATRRGIVLLVGSDKGHHWTARDYLELMGNGRIDGLLLMGAEMTDPPDTHWSTIDIPHMHLNRRPSDTSRWVILDDERAARIAVEHLASLGHVRLAHVAGPLTADTAKRRTAGFLSGYTACGLEGSPHVEIGDYTAEGGSAALRRMWAAGVAPTGIVAANIPTALGILRGAKELNIRIPKELSVVALHDSELAEYTHPTLTSVRMPLQALGARGVELLCRLPADAEVQEIVSGEIKLVVRESTGPAKKASSAARRTAPASRSAKS